MLITFTLLIILSIGAFIISMYSSILPFAQNLGNIEQYNQSYCEAYTNIENALLVSKYQWAGFSGSWWFTQETLRWPQSSQYNENIQESYRTIQWKTEQIPHNQQTKTIYNTDEEKIFAVLKKGETIDISLTIDTTNTYEQYYNIDNENNTLFNWDKLELTIILPQKIQEALWEEVIDGLLCDEEQPNCIIDNESQVFDDIIRSRTIQWEYLGDEFSINPYTTVEDRIVDYTQDTNIREFVINNENDIIPNIIRDSWFNPIKNNTLADNIWKQNSTWTAGASMQWQTFQDIFTNENIQNLRLTLEFINPALSRNNNEYPFLLYQIQSDVAIPNTYYTIRGVGMINNKKISIQIQKPL
jgi:hypothetical protein